MKKLSILLLLTGIWNCSFGQSSYFPIKKGTTLTYAYSDELYKGQSVDVSQLKMTVKVLNETQSINGKDYFVSETSTGGLAPDFKSYIRIGNDGSILSMEEGETEESLMMKKSPTVGDSWITNKKAGESKNKVVGLDGTIKTPAGTYTNCLVLEIFENGTMSKGYFKENLGMVAVSVMMGGSEKLFVYLVDEG
ncbi:MAG: hypothetical protein AAF551_04675 [Bacteroidota bacterium]